MGRVRVYDAEDIAKGMVRSFKDREPEYVENFRWRWPSYLQNVGDSLAVAYASDKWKPKDSQGKREMELYKHLAESRNRAFVKPGLLHDYYDTNSEWPVIGPETSFEDVPMPNSFAILGLFEEVDLQLYCFGDEDGPEFSDDPDEGIVKVTVRHGMLGGSKFLWSKVGQGSDEPFIFVYTRSAGVLMIMTGEELDIEKDGIVG